MENRRRNKEDNISNADPGTESMYDRRKDEQSGAPVNNNRENDNDPREDGSDGNERNTNRPDADGSPEGN